MASDQKSSQLKASFSAFAVVLFDKGPNRPLDYGILKQHLPLAQTGARVLAPLKGFLRRGTIIEIKKRSLFPKVCPLEEILSKESLLSPELFELAKWMSTYYCTPMRQVLRTLLPSSIRGEQKEKNQLFVKPLVSPTTLRKEGKSAAQQKIIEALLNTKEGMLLTTLLDQTKCSKSPVTTLLKKKLIEVKPILLDRSPLKEFDFFPTKPKTLNGEQADALQAIRADLKKGTFHTHLLFGVTGSGKTEVYMQAMWEAREQNKGVILLVPEIALTSQTIERLKSRFSDKIGILHSRLSQGEQFDMWHSIRSGDTSIVVGARSAIFSPVAHLGLIIIDEEHETSYKQTEEQPCYHARDIGIMRGKINSATVVLGSATPSLESYAKAKEGKYHLRMLSQRAEKSSLPKVRCVDMNVEWGKKRGFNALSESLLEGIKKRVALGEQTLLFLNRRGYQTFLLCKGCKEALKCPHCDLSLTFHKKENTLSCHLCTYTLSPPPRTCPSCKKGGHFEYKGIGTQKVEQALRAIFPTIRTLRMDADTTRYKGSHETLLKQFRSGKADVLIGTQMIGKGLHFPTVTLVGILNTDGALNIPDFRASEKVFQLLLQVAGRSGRSDLPGEVIIQTRLNTHPLFSLAMQGDYPSFFTREMEGRELFHFPPFTRLAKLVFSGKCEKEVERWAQTFRDKLTFALPPSFTLYPIIPCGYAKIKDLYRFKLLIKGDKIYRLSKELTRLLSSSPLPRKIRLLIDIDPISTL